MSKLVETLLWQIRDANLPEPVRELRFAPPRRWRFDMAWPACMVAMEVEGGVWTRGRHTRGTGFLLDMEKYNAAGLAGWLVLRASSCSIKAGDALEALQEALSKAMTRGRARTSSLRDSAGLYGNPPLASAPVSEDLEDLAFSGSA